MSFTDHGNSERRRHPRLRKNLALKITSGDFDIVTETENISCIGAYCSVDRPLEPMMKLKILVLLPIRKRKSVVNKQVTCEGVVVRSDPAKNNRYNVAIFFSDIDTKNMRIISEYISEQMHFGNSA